MEREGSTPFPRPRSPFLVMHFLRPRIPFVLKFKEIRLWRAAGGRGRAWRGRDS